ncbi:MAG: FapA family protein [Leptospiraceae bacterium]|nr:FapA family protein [Leptospiraceae bacterium]
MDKLKGLFFEEESKMDRDEREKVEVIGESIDECLRLAAKHLNKPIHLLEYEVLKRGKKGLFMTEPFQILVYLADPEDSLEDLALLDEKLGTDGKLVSKDLKDLITPKDVDGYFRIKNLRHGLYLACFPPVGAGKPVRYEDVVKKLNMRGIMIPPEKRIKEVISEITEEYERLADSKLKPFAEAAIKIELSPDNMKAYATFTPPKAGGRDLEVQDVVYELKKEDIAYGIKEEDIRYFLENEIYNEPVVVAVGDPPVRGNDAKIIYHVRTEKVIRLKEDSSGRVDFKNLDLIENVVTGQLLAEKIPAGEGKWGRDLRNSPLEAKDGMDLDLLPGKGTILSEDKMKLIADVNGQVIFAEGRVNVETVYRVNGDVNNKTGNITFLGSIVITGNVEDNFQIKASGNIEIYGTVQKAIVEADGDIIIRQGITGREEARISSSSGNIISKFIQDANIFTEKDVMVQEGILNSNINAGGKIVCNGKRGQIVGGKLRAGKMILAKNLGSKANPITELIVGLNPKLLKQVEDYEEKKNQSKEKVEALIKTQKTIVARKEADPASFTEENEAYLLKVESGIKKLEKRIAEYEKEIQTLRAYMEQSAIQGKVYFEKKMYPGVSVILKNSEPYSSKMEIISKTLYLENDKIRQKPYSDPESERAEKPIKKKTIKTGD